MEETQRQQDNNEDNDDSARGKRAELLQCGDLTSQAIVCGPTTPRVQRMKPDAAVATVVEIKAQMLEYCSRDRCQRW